MEKLDWKEVRVKNEFGVVVIRKMIKQKRLSIQYTGT